jgi:MFS family permease
MEASTKSADKSTDHPASLWRHRNFMLLWSGQSVGAIGPQISVIALPLYALDSLHADVFQVSLLTFFGWLPYLLFSLPAGIVVDRWNHRLLMISCDVGRMVLTLSVPLLGLYHLLSLWYLYTVVGIIGILTVLFTVAYRGQLPKLVSSDQLVDGNAKLGISDSLAELIGPSIGGALVGLIGAINTLFGAAGTFSVSAITLGLIRVPKAERKPDAGQRPLTLRSIIRDGLGYVLGERVLRNLLICTGISNFFLIGVSSIAIPFLRRDLHASAAAIGVVFTLGSVGGILAGILAARVSRRVGSARIIWLSMLLPGPLYLLMPLAQPNWGVLLYAVGIFAVAAATTLFNVGAITYRQLVTPPEILSRVNGAYLWVSYGSIPLGSLFGGALGTLLGLRPTIWICVLGVWSGSLFLVFSPLRKMLNLPR